MATNPNEPFLMSEEFQKQNGIETLKVFPSVESSKGEQSLLWADIKGKKFAIDCRLHSYEEDLVRIIMQTKTPKSLVGWSHYLCDIDDIYNWHLCSDYTIIPASDFIAANTANQPTQDRETDHADIGKLVEMDNDIDVVGKCANCGVEYHIHKPLNSDRETEEKLHPAIQSISYEGELQPETVKAINTMVEKVRAMKFDDPEDHVPCGYCHGQAWVKNKDQYQHKFYQPVAAPPISDKLNVSAILNNALRHLSDEELKTLHESIGSRLPAPPISGGAMEDAKQIAIKYAGQSNLDSNQFEGLYRAIYSHAREVAEKEAIEFARWCAKRYKWNGQMQHWNIRGGYGNPEHEFSTTALYLTFKNKKA